MTMANLANCEWTDVRVQIYSTLLISLGDIF